MNRRLALLAAVAGLAACASPATRPVAAQWTTGRLLVIVDAFGDKAAHSMAADFELRGDARQGELRLTAPLGATLAQARWAPGEALLDTGRGEARYADLDELAAVAFGEALPLRALPDWLAGRPWTGAPSRATGGGFEQLGWQVSLRRRAEGWIEAVRPSVPAVTVRARVEPSS